MHAKLQKIEICLLISLPKRPDLAKFSAQKQANFEKTVKCLLLSAANRRFGQAKIRNLKICLLSQFSPADKILEIANLPAFSQITVHSQQKFTATSKNIIYRIKKSGLLSKSGFLILHGWGWIRTTEAICSRFTVCPLWPLGNPSIDAASLQRTYFL